METPKKVSKHPLMNPLDATNYTISYLSGQFTKKNWGWIDRLDFVNGLFVTDRLREKEAGRVLLPPKAVRRDRSAITEFLRLGINQKIAVIQGWEGCEIEINLEVEEDGLSEKEEIDEKIEEAEGEEVVICGGFTLADVASSKIEDVETVEKGFCHVVRESWIARSNLQRPGNEKYECMIVNREKAYQTGVVTTGSGDGTKVVMTVEEPHGSNGKFENCVIRHVECKLDAALKGKRQCESCNSLRKSLFRRCKERVQIREEPLSKHATDATICRSMTLQQARSLEQRSRLKELRQKYKKAIAKQRLAQCGVDLKVSECDEVFSEDLLPHVRDFLSKEVCPDSIAEYMFEESVRKQKIAKKSGRTAIRHDPSFTFSSTCSLIPTHPSRCERSIWCTKSTNLKPIE